MRKRILEEPIELTDAELDVVSGGIQSVTGWIHEDNHEQSDFSGPHGRTETEKGGLPGTPPPLP
jgi:hypothetical protein